MGCSLAPMRRLAVTLRLLAVLAVLAAPAVWSLTPAIENITSDLPVAGATTMVGNAAPANTMDTALISYLEAHQGTATYLVATPSSNAADAIILATGESAWQFVACERASRRDTNIKECESVP